MVAADQSRCESWLIWASIINQRSTARGRDAPLAIDRRVGNAQISLRLIIPAIVSAWRIASATMVSVGLHAAPVVNWLPSETNRFLMSCVWPHLFTTPSRALALMRLVPRLCVLG